MTHFRSSHDHVEFLPNRQEKYFLSPFQAKIEMRESWIRVRVQMYNLAGGRTRKEFRFWFFLLVE
jgi:hypothetical protein